MAQGIYGIQYIAFLDLEKAYNPIDSQGLSMALRMYKVGGKLLNCTKVFYVIKCAKKMTVVKLSESLGKDVEYHPGCSISLGICYIFKRG